MGSWKRCELCNNGAALHCDADSAYLCWGCDAKVHGANFLVARHVRIILCCRCHEFTALSTCVACPNSDNCFCSECSNWEYSDETQLLISSAESGTSGGGSSSPNETTKDPSFKKCLDQENHRLVEVCGNPVSEVSIDEWSWSNSKDSNTNPDSQQKRRQKKPLIRKYSVAINSDMKVEAILRRWYRYLNLRSPSTVTLAMHVVEKGLNKLGGLFRQKWRICLATSLWVAATLCENQSNFPSLKRFSECTLVPSELILKVESRLVAILDWKMHDKEGWAECST